MATYGGRASFVNRSKSGQAGVLSETVASDEYAILSIKGDATLSVSGTGHSISSQTITATSGTVLYFGPLASISLTVTGGSSFSSITVFKNVG